MKKKHQSQSLKQLALKNIKRKHKIIKTRLTDGIPYLLSENGDYVRDSDGEKILDFHPTSLRGFYSWNGSQNCTINQKKIGEISGTGTTTLDSNPDLKSEIINDLNSLKKKYSIQLENENKTSELQCIRSELELEKIQRTSAESKYLTIVLKYEKLKVKLHNAARAKEQTNE